MKKLTAGDIETKVSRLLFKYRMTPHSTTGITPAQLMFQRDIRTPFHLLQPGNQDIAKAVRKEITRGYQQGDAVWVKNFGKGDQWMEGEVEARKGNVNYAIRLNTGLKNIVHRHIDQLRKRHLVKTQIAESSEIDVDIDIPVSTTPTEVAEATLRRSNRVIKKPARLGDFVSK